MPAGPCCHALAGRGPDEQVFRRGDPCHGAQNPKACRSAHSYYPSGRYVGVLRLQSSQEGFVRQVSHHRKAVANQARNKCTMGAPQNTNLQAPGGTRNLCHYGMSHHCSVDNIPHTGLRFRHLIQGDTQRPELGLIGVWQSPPETRLEDILRQTIFLEGIQHVAQSPLFLAAPDSLSPPIRSPAS